jgi:Tol biopolymer transport system component
MVVFTSDRNAKGSGGSNIFTMNLDGTNPKALTSDSGGKNYCDAPLFSRDGQKIIFASNNGVNGGYEIFSINPDGSNKTNLTNNAAFFRE